MGLGRWNWLTDWDAISDQAKNVDLTPRIIHAAVPGKVLHLKTWVISCKVDAEITIQDTDGNDLIGPLYIGPKGGHDKTTLNLGELKTPVGKGIQAVSNVATVSTVWIAIYNPRDP